MTQVYTCRMTDEKALLVEALTRANASNRGGATLLGGPTETFVKTMSEAMARCPSFQAIKGGVFSCPSMTVPNIVEDMFMSRLAIRSFKPTNVPSAIDWLLDVWRTRTTRGFHVAAIWGMSLSRAIRLNPTDTLMPFSEVPDSPFKRTITKQATRRGSVYPWQSQSEWQEPTAALIREVPEWAYIQEPPGPYSGEWFPTSDDVDFFAVLAILLGTPIVSGSGSALHHESLDIYSHRQYVHWEHPEVAPTIERVNELNPTAFESQWNAFRSFPSEWRKRLLRAAARFHLSQCRREPIDRLLDLALAYEIILSGGSETNAGISWKLAVRTAQIIGGDTDTRIATRDQVNDFYSIRSRASHGTDISASADLLNRATATFRRLFLRLSELGVEPDWKRIELGILPPRNSNG